MRAQLHLSYLTATLSVHLCFKPIFPNLRVSLQLCISGFEHFQHMYDLCSTLYMNIPSVNTQTLHLLLPRLCLLSRHRVKLKVDIYRGWIEIWKFPLSRHPEEEKQQCKELFINIVIKLWFVEKSPWSVQWTACRPTPSSLPIHIWSHGRAGS